MDFSMIIINIRKRLPLAAATACLLGVFWAAAPVRAELAPAGSRCPGNICGGELTVGADKVRYSFTQHVAPDGEFKIRLNGGVYNTASLISFIIFDLPPFASWDVYDAGSGNEYLPGADVNPGRTAYERRAPGGCAGCRVDQVMSVKYAGLAEGPHTFNLFILQNGGSASKNNLEFYVDSGAPSNGDENESLAPIAGTSLTCADRTGGAPIDNDLDFRANCADLDCDGAQGDLINSELRCEKVEQTCFDKFDNDADGATDCQDVSCDGLIGQQAPRPLAYCQYGNEYGDLLSLSGTSPCEDFFDNDADGREDCFDNKYTETATGALTVYGFPNLATAQSKICWRHPAYGCPLTEISCTDGLDNDIDRPYKDQEYPEAEVSAVPSTVPPAVGRDCRDYDCAGAANCPDQENHEETTQAIRECQCFDGVDNDLDRLLDCKDPDCIGAYCDTGENTGRVCLDKEFDLGQRIQMCANEFDDDGDGPQDCADIDCKQKFGDCGPCPNREDFTFEACADGRDNDVNGQVDCRDPRCHGLTDGIPKFGRILDAAYCAEPAAAAESDDGSYPPLCADRFDNDSDGKIDCADPSCNNFDTGSGGPYCETPAERSCGDGYDNDGNGRIDCLDPACYGEEDCEAVDWDLGGTFPGCIEVPRMSVLAPFTANDPTVWAQSYATVHVNATLMTDVVDRVRIKGTDVYPSVTMVIGDNTDVSKVYPYASAAACRIVDTPSGGGSGDFGLTVAENAQGGGAIMVFNLPGRLPANFDITVECPTPEEPASGVRNYPVSISVLRVGNIPEYGEILVSSRLYEATQPEVREVEVEGEDGPGLIAVPYGQPRYFRVIPRDPGMPPRYASGICQCSLELVGESPVFTSVDGACSIPSSFKFVRDFRAGDTPSDLTVRATSLDGAANRSGAFERPFTVNVTPSLGDVLFIEPRNAPSEGDARPFFNKKETGNVISVSSRDTNASVPGQFITAVNDGFTSACKLFIRNSAGTIIGPGWIDVPNLNAGLPGLENIANCVAGDLPLPAALLGPGGADGVYFATLIAEDDDGDAIESVRRPMFMCDSVPDAAAPNNDGDVCHWADFDSDGAAEGFYTKLYSDDAKACDNCVNLWNDDQKDDDANGIGNDCQSLKGRCEVDTDIVCGRHSFTWDDPESPGTCPPGPKCCDDLSDPDCCPEPTVKVDGADAPIQPTQACREPWGACSTGGEICFTPENCPPRGTCTGGPSGQPIPTDSCNSDDDCCADPDDCVDDEDDPVTNPCVSADLCLSLMYPWIQAPKGNVYSGRYIRAPEPPPPGRANATFCISSKSGTSWTCSVPLDLSDPVNKPQGCAYADRKYVFTSEECGDPRTKPGSRLERPKSRNIYSSVLGRLDLGGLLTGKYGEVVTVADPDLFVEDYLSGFPLDGKVYLVNGDLHIGDVPETPPDAEDVPTIEIDYAPEGSRGAGTVLVMGGNLYLWDNVTYDQNLTEGLTSLERLASLGWIVLDETDPESPGYGTKGNVFIGSGVTELVGAFFVGGQGGIYTVAPPETDSKNQLTIRGLMVARQFHFSRSFKSVDQGSEKVLYDGRAVVNPPPGFGDVTKTLPYFGDVATTP